jgi:hypothetical protein
VQLHLARYVPATVVIGGDSVSPLAFTILGHIVAQFPMTWSGGDVSARTSTEAG